jgi:hypothetical protein
MKDKKAVGEYVMDAIYKIPNTTCGTRDFKIEVWDSDDEIILDIPIIEPRDKSGKLSVMIMKKELKELFKRVIPINDKSRKVK